MRTVELRRHSERAPSGGLTKAGVELARDVASDLLPHYARVIASDKPRAQETAAAFGFPEQEVDGRFGTMAPRLTGEAAGELARLQEQGHSILQSWLTVPAAVASLRPQAESYWEAVREVALSISEGGAVLIVSHGGAIEPAIMAGTGNWSLAAFGGRELGSCEGVRLRFDGDQLAGIEMCRHPLDG